MKNQNLNQVKNFYIDSVRNRPSALTFNAMVCLYTLLQQKLEAYFKEFSLSPVKFNTLMILKYLNRGAGLGQNEIGHHLIASPSNITRLVDRLIKDGFVERTESKTDRRVRRIRITAKGEKVLDASFKGYGETIQQSVYLMPRKDVETLSELLFEWFQKLSTANNDTKQPPA